MKHRKNAASSYYEPGTPFYSFTPEGKTAESSLRVMPSRFVFPTLPAACTFIRNLNQDNESGFF